MCLDAINLRMATLTPSRKLFLTAEWRKLAFANYAVDPAVLKPYLPAATELDIWQGNCYVSLVGFMFLNTKLKGIKVPCHANFEEVNLRFYVRYNDAGVWKRGVVFIKEIVPRPALTLVANRIYNEPYQTLPMRHSWQQNINSLNVSYSWKKKSWNHFSVTAQPVATPIAANSAEEFITEHYWGYTKLSASLTSQYEVQHPRWDMYAVKDYTIEVDFEDIYGPQFAFLQTAEPISMMLAEGSEVSVRVANKIRV